jgi:hypothetical protein
VKNKSKAGRSHSKPQIFFAEIFEPRLLLSTTYDAAKDFSLTKNPNGPWSYGVRFSEMADYANFGIPAATALDFGSGAMGWSENSGSPPYVGTNVNGTEYDSEGINLPTGVLVMHPGGNGEYADTRFTVPQSGTIVIKYEFAGIDTNGTTTDVHILYNNTSKVDDNIDQYGQSNSGQITLRDAAAGDTVDFIVGTGSNHTFYSDATSFEATITGGVSDQHLVFTQQPKNGNVYLPEALQVKLEDSNNHVVTNATQGVTLHLNDSTSSNISDSAEVYVAFKNGVATFTAANGPVITTVGNYTLTADEVGAAGIPYGNAIAATSNPFVIRGLFMVFIKQPPLVNDQSQAIPFTVALETPKHKIVTSAAAAQSLEFETKIVSNNGINGIFAGGTLTGGKYTNDAPGNPDPVTISIGAGTSEQFYINVFQVDSNGQMITTTGVGYSRAFKIVGPHLVFTKQPSLTGVEEPIPFAVQLVDSKNRLVTGSNTNLLLSIPLPAETTSAIISPSFVTSTYDNSKPQTDIPALSLPFTGTYTISASVVAPDTGVAIPSVALITSKPFAIVADHFVFKRQPSNVAINTPIPFQITLQDPHNKVVPFTTGDTESVAFKINAIAGNGTFTNGIANTGLTNGVYDNVVGSMFGQFEINSSGTYSFSIDMEDEEDHVLTGFTGVTSKVFKIN